MQLVVFGGDQISDVKLRRHVRHLGKARQLAVYIDIEAGIHPGKMQPGAAVGERFGQVKARAVHAHGGVIGNKRRIVGDRIPDVGVLRHAIPLHLPAAGHRDLLGWIHRPHVLRDFARAVEQLKVPRAVE